MKIECTSQKISKICKKITCAINNLNIQQTYDVFILLYNECYTRNGKPRKGYNYYYTYLIILWLLQTIAITNTYTVLLLLHTTESSPGSSDKFVK